MSVYLYVFVKESQYIYMMWMCVGLRTPIYVFKWSKKRLCQYVCMHVPVNVGQSVHDLELQLAL